MDQVSGMKDWENEVVSLYAVRAIPENVVVDPSGKIIAKDLYGDDLKGTLSGLLDITSFFCAWQIPRIKKLTR